MSDLQLMTRDDAQRSIEITADAQALKNDALAAAGLIGKVRNAGDQENAVDAMKQLKRVISETERSRKEVKQPVIDFGRLIDGTARTFVDEVQKEFNRVARAVSDFQSLEAEKVRAAEALRLAELAKIEREREAAIAKAKSVEEVEAIREDADTKALAESQKVEKQQPARVQGQVVREVWDYEVTDIHTLARCHPNCVKITPLSGEIKQLLEMGVDVKGVRGWKETRSSVRP